MWSSHLLIRLLHLSLVELQTAGAANPGRQRGQRAAATAARRKMQPITLDDGSGEDAGGAAGQPDGRSNGEADAGNSSGSSDFEAAAARHIGSSDDDS